MSAKRFRIAFSFAGEKRDFVAKVASILAGHFGEDAILYDKYHEAEFARYDLGVYLPKLYSEQSDLIVPVLCPAYDRKRWTGWEWVHIYGLLTKEDGWRVMPCRFEHANADGLSPASGFIELGNKTPAQAAALILERLALNEGHPKDHYAKGKATPPQPAAKQQNPFQTAGALRHDHPTYLQRPADAEFENALQGPSRLISITGEYEIGKSSLMNQARRILQGYEFFGGGLASSNSHDEARFMHYFFKLFTRRFGAVADWDELDEHTRHCPSVLFLDDLGEVAAPGLGVLIPALVERLATPGPGLRAITTSPQKLRTMFADRKLGNPRYSRPWQNIVVGQLPSSEARRLLELLQPRARSLALARIQEIEATSQLRPKKLQCLCQLLYDAECNGFTDEALITLVQTEKSYCYE
ncbi:MAG: hypothetical protein JO295_00455 [Verrucomicrobia bacterium]|nr:hypothetical protein [Verrucomicrobiota bacterium]